MEDGGIEWNGMEQNKMNRYLNTLFVRYALDGFPQMTGNKIDRLAAYYHVITTAETTLKRA